ncbi:acyltransferase [Sphingomonas sp. HITSZ_GF]|uniref:acyltransferase family protein n=1 Tax=Sphingomonas sp. HITSZ_GF TaxID=3037247 RepID=UPI00240DAAFF|nr:acyltransferase [Sphingomonas sp. HITSZ_GF]MDG2534905.1 acyltransferase [Sphingomonas sp. HITSZ_GF]
MRDWLSIERATAELQGRKHSVELQSVRGLASLAVVLHHCCFYYDYGAGLRRLSEIAINAHAAVVTFFVLSGFVLTISLSRRPIDLAETSSFYLRRAFRIYPALWVSLLVALGYALLFHGMPKPETVSLWWNPHSREFLTPVVALLSVMGVFTLFPVPIWSLFVELIGSFLMPGIAWLLFRRTRLFLLVAVLLAILSQIGGFSIVVAPVYLVDFALGAGIVLIAPAIAPRLRNDRVAVVAALVAFCALWFGRNLVAGDFMTDYESKPAALIEAVAATALIAVLYVRADLFGFLRSRPLTWLGDVSYSLYLLHLPILGLVAGIGSELLGIWPFAGGGLPATFALMLLVVPLSLASAAFSYRFVELPAMRLGKPIAEGWGRWIRSLGRP